VDPLARGVPAAGGAVAGLLAVLRVGSTEVGVRMPRSAGAFESKRGDEDAEDSQGQQTGARSHRLVEGT
jgi:hypothetical protein